VYSKNVSESSGAVEGVNPPLKNNKNLRLAIVPDEGFFIYWGFIW